MTQQTIWLPAPVWPGGLSANSMTVANAWINGYVENVVGASTTFVSWVYGTAPTTVAFLGSIVAPGTTYTQSGTVGYLTGTLATSQVLVDLPGTVGLNGVLEGTLDIQLGTMVVANLGAALELSGNATIGGAGPGSAELQVAQAGSVGSSQSLLLESGGSLLMQGIGSDLTVAGMALGGQETIDSGAYAWGGAIALTTGTLQVRDSGTSFDGSGYTQSGGLFNLTQSAHASVSNDAMIQAGTLTVWGTNATFGAARLFIGSGGAGSVDVSGASTMAIGGLVELGSAGGAGVLSTEGAGSTLSLGSNLLLGVGGGAQGSLYVSLGATLSLTGTLQVGDGGGGQLSLDGGGSTLAAGAFAIAGTAAGFTISNGAIASAASAAVGGGGVVTIVGNGSALNVGSFGLAAGGTLAMQSGGVLGAGTVGASGSASVLMQGGTINTEAVALGTGSGLAGYGVINAGIANAGAITASGGALDLAGSISGAGTLAIADNATLSLGGAVAAGQDVAFAIGTAIVARTLDLTDFAAFSGTIGGFQDGDVIDIAGLAANGASLAASGRLTLTAENLATGTPPASLGTLAFSLLPGIGFALAADGAGGTEIIAALGAPDSPTLASLAWSIDNGITSNGGWNVIASDANAGLGLQENAYRYGSQIVVAVREAYGSPPLLSQAAAEIAGFVANLRITQPGETISLTGDAAGGTLATLVGQQAGYAAMAFAGSTGAVLQAVVAAQLACFRAGTRLATEHGATAVENLRIGDMMRLADGRLAALRWIGRRDMDCARHPAPETVWPVRVRRGAFADGVPCRDLYLSPDHAVFAAGVLIPVRELVNGGSVAAIRQDRVTWFHVELEHHDVLLAEGLAVESWLDTGNRGAFANASEPTQLHADFARDPACAWEAACAKLVLVGPVVERLRAHLATRDQAAAALNTGASAR